MSPLAQAIAAELGVGFLVLRAGLNYEEVPCTCGDPACTGVRARAKIEVHAVNTPAGVQVAPVPERKLQIARPLL